jgi:hypothetical protein
MSSPVSFATPTPADPLDDWLCETESERCDPRVQEAHRLARQAAERLREALCCVPFYAKGAAQAQALHGDEMVYWLDLQASEATLVRLPIGCSAK